MAAQNKLTKVWSTITMMVVLVKTQEVVCSTTLSWR